MNAAFSQALLLWQQTDNERELPWKSETDPYKIWLSEIILQQTRADQAIPYYQKFIQQYPTLKKLARASDDEVFRLWQGLGYYNRCKNMLRTARELVSQGQSFPNTYEGLLALKGIGPYTAAAIASFAFGLNHAVLDGNVYRVLSRFFGISTPIDSTAGKKEFSQLAQSLLPHSAAAAYNQAIMDFGALVCKPKRAACDVCPLSQNCVAYRREAVALFPVKKKKLKVQQRHFHYLVLEHKEEVFIQQRSPQGIWPGLYEFLLVETQGEKMEQKEWSSIGMPLKQQPLKTDHGRQRLTHQLIHSYFYHIELATKPKPALKGKWISKTLIKNYAFPKTIVSFLHRKKYF